MELITSKSNEKVKLVKSLNEKKFRDKLHAFFVENIKVINEILDNKAIDIMFIAYSQDILLKQNGGDELLQRLQNAKNINIFETESDILKYMCDTVTTQGVIAVIKMPIYDMNTEIDSNNKNILILDQIQDAGNLGTIIRSADAFNVSLIICTKGTVDVYSPKVVRSTMGSIFRVKVIYVEDIDELKNLKQKGYSIVSTILESENYIDEIDYSEKIAFVLGNEANGVSLDIKNISDKNIKIKMLNTAESLNVSIAAGIILYEQFKNKN